MKKKLKEVATIQIGYPFRAGIDTFSHGIFKVIQLRDFNENNSLNIKSSEAVNLESVDPKYRVKKNDLIFLSKGSRYFVSVIDLDLENIVAASYFTIIRPKQQLLSYYLLWYLTLEPSINYFLKQKKGTVLPTISKDIIENLIIEVPSLQLQQSIVSLNRLRQKEKNLNSKLLEKREQLINHICKEALKGEN